MFSLFATLKPMRGEDAVHQTNAVKSWMQMGREIILYGEEAGPLASKLNLPYHEGVDRESGIPSLKSLFKLAQGDANNDLIGYMNADVVIVEGLVEAVEKVSRSLPNFLMVCRRWDIDLDEELDFKKDWRAFVKRRITEANELHSDCSSDLFLFKRPLWDVLPFTPGRPSWDNWMFFRACEANLPVVDVTPVVTMAHPNHGYGGDRLMDVRTFWRTSPSVERNRSLGAGTQFCFRHVERAGNLWRLDKALRKL